MAGAYGVYTAGNKPINGRDGEGPLGVTPLPPPSGPGLSSSVGGGGQKEGEGEGGRGRYIRQKKG